MPEYHYRFAAERATTFVQTEKAVWLSQLFGLPCGMCGRETSQPQAQGLVLLETDGGRFEGEQLVLKEGVGQKDGLRLVWAAGSDLRIESVWSFCAQTGVWSRSDTLHNVGRGPVTLLRYLYRFAFSPGHYEVYSQGSRWCNENQGCWQPLQHGTLLLRCEGGRTAQGGTPFLGLREVGGEGGVAFHLLPCGNWTMRVRARTAGGDALCFAVVEAGLADEDLRLKLAPGESMEMPRLLFHSLPQGQEHLAAPRLHRYVNANLLTAVKPYAPLMYNTWFDAFDVLDVPRLRRQLAAARDIGCEVFTIDAGWYGAAPGGWSAAVGDWRERQDGAFYGRMAAFAEEVRAAGLGFGIWMEPERIGPAAPILREHPEWCLPATHGHYRPDLTNPAAYAYLLGEMSRLISTYRLAWMKVDFNLDFGVDASGAEFYTYCTAWYRLLDELRARHPETFIEACASGGMRFDLNTLRHFDGHFLSDTINPIDSLRIHQGALLRLPPGRATIWSAFRAVGRAIPAYGKPIDAAPVTLVTPMGAIWQPSVTASVDFVVRACLPGMWGLSGDLSELPDEALERLRFHVAFYKKWRAFISGAVAHLLTPPRPKEDRAGWAALQLQHPQEPHHLLFAYRLDDQSERKRFYPRDLVPEQEYVVEDLDHPQAAGKRSGAALMADGVEISLPGKYSAAIVCLLG